MYPKTKDVKWFAEQQDDFFSLKENQRNSKASRAKANQADESVSQSSFEGSSAQDGSHRLGRQHTLKNRLGSGAHSTDPKKRSELIKREVGFASIEEESQIGLDQNLTVKLASKDQKKKEPKQAEKRQRLTVKEINFEKLLLIRKERQNKVKTYDPYSSVVIRDFDGISRAEIDRLVVKMKKAKLK